MNRRGQDDSCVADDRQATYSPIWGDGYCVNCMRVTIPSEKTQRLRTILENLVEDKHLNFETVGKALAHAHGSYGVKEVFKIFEGMYEELCEEEEFRKMVLNLLQR